MEENGKRTILVAGTGPAGLAAALALAPSGHEILLVGPPPGSDDRRTTALMRPAVELLDRLGLQNTISGMAAPLVTMRIVDATERLVRSPTVTFHAAEIGEEAFGLNIPNAVLTAELTKAVRRCANIVWHESLVEEWHPAAGWVEARLADDTVLRAALVVAADGRRSPARAAAGIPVSARSLPQSALVLNFAHTRHHAFTSTELHTEHGPCTQVPLPGGFRSSLVWVTRPEHAEELAALDGKELARRIEMRQQSFLGKITVEPGLQVYPLSSVLPSRFAARRIALVGEAAHVFPPITAQGLNLGLRDIMDLAAIVSANPADPGLEAVLQQYDARRRPDILARSSAVSLVNASLLSDLLPAQLARSAGLSLLGSVPALRGFFMREGMRPGSGFAALLPPLSRFPRGLAR